MGEYILTNGAIEKIMRDKEVKNPVLQILAFKKIAGQDGTDHFRLHISDGSNSHSFAMLATQLNQLIQDKAIENFAVIRVDKMILNIKNKKRIMIIRQLTVIGSGNDVGKKLGNPIPWQENDVTPAPASSAPASNVNGLNAAKNEPLSSVPVGKFDGSNSSNIKNSGQSSSGPSFSKSPGAPSGPSKPSVMPISVINLFVNKLPFRARVTNKSEIRNYLTARGPGKLFSVDLLDDSSEIRMTFFNNDVDKFYNMIEVSNVYLVSEFDVKDANKRFTSIEHACEISSRPGTSIQPYLSDASDIPKQKFTFLPIGKIEDVEKDTLIDVIGICKRVEDCQTINSRSSGKEFKKRDIILVDQSNKEINLTLWGKNAEEFNDDSQSVVAVKAAKVSDFGGKSISVAHSSIFYINPDIVEAHKLRGWYTNGGSTMESQSLSVGGKGRGSKAVWKVLREANEAENIDLDKGEYFMAKVTLMAIKKDNVLYKACANESCNKKVVDQNNGLYRCEKCCKDYTTFKWHLMLYANFADSTGNIWSTSFRNNGETMLGHKAEDLGNMSQTDPDEFQRVLSNAKFSEYIVKFRAKMENYNGETRKKFMVQDLQKVNYGEYTKKLLAELKETA